MVGGPGPPLWTIWKSIGMRTATQDMGKSWENKTWQPNHQPGVVENSENQSRSDVDPVVMSHLRSKANVILWFGYPFLTCHNQLVNRDCSHSVYSTLFFILGIPKQCGRRGRNQSPKINQSRSFGWLQHIPSVESRLTLQTYMAMENHWLDMK